MRPLLFLPSLEIGGCEVFFASLAAELGQRLPRLTLCVPPVSVLADLLSKSGNGRLRRLGWMGAEQRCGSDWGSFDRQLNAAHRMLRDAAPDFIFMVLPSPDSALGVMAACHERGIPGVCIFQLAAEVLHLPLRERLRAGSALSSGLLAPVVVSAQNRPLLAETFKIRQERIRVVRNSTEFGPGRSGDRMSRAETRRQIGARPDQKIITTVARLTPQKGYDLLLEVARWWQGDGRDDIFLWIGDGEWRGHIEKEAADLGNVVMTGYVESDLVHRYLEASDLFVLPSRWEGSPLALSEAMSLKIPIVASDIDSITEMVGTDMAFLFRAGSAADLMYVLRHAADNPHEREARASAALDRYLGYRKSDMIETYMRMIHTS